MSVNKQNTFYWCSIHISEINDSKINCFILIHCSIPLIKVGHRFPQPNANFEQKVFMNGYNKSHNWQFSGVYFNCRENSNKTWHILFNKVKCLVTWQQVPTTALFLYRARVKMKLTEIYDLKTKHQLTLKTPVKHIIKQAFFPAYLK